jgi:hypothetical protein
MKFVKFIWKVLKGEGGGFNLGKILSYGVDDMWKDALGDGGETTTQDQYPDLRKKLTDYLGQKIGTSTPYKYNDAFTIDQPEVEKQAESNILGYLKNPTTNVSDYGEATKKYSEANKASREIAYEDERKKSQNMYNRLGLVSSTPGLSAMSDINRKQTAESNLFDSELMYKNLDRQLTAQGLDVNQLNAMLTQAGTLGQTQRSSQEYSQKMSLQDLIRQLQEEQGYTSDTLGLITGNAQPKTTYEPSTMEQLLATLGQVAPYALMAM